MRKKPAAEALIRDYLRDVDQMLASARCGDRLDIIVAVEEHIRTTIAALYRSPTIAEVRAILKNIGTPASIVGTSSSFQHRLLQPWIPLAVWITIIVGTVSAAIPSALLSWPLAWGFLTVALCLVSFSTLWTLVEQVVCVVLVFGGAALGFLAALTTLSVNGELLTGFHFQTLAFLLAALGCLGAESIITARGLRRATLMRREVVENASR